MIEEEKRRKILGEKISIARTKKEWSRRYLAEMIGVSVSTIYVIETGKRPASPTMLTRLNKALGTDFDANGRARVKVSLGEAVRLAREEGLSYGEWVRMHQGE